MITVAELLRGEANLDKKRAEILSFITINHGAIHGESRTLLNTDRGGTLSYLAESGGCWMVHVWWTTGNSKAKVDIEYKERTHGRIALAARHNVELPRLEYVEEVHADLDTLLQGLCGDFSWKSKANSDITPALPEQYDRHS